jgi:hypothetical protein
VPLSLCFLLATRRYGIIFQQRESASMEWIAALEPIPNILTTVPAPRINSGETGADNSATNSQPDSRESRQELNERDATTLPDLRDTIAQTMVFRAPPIYSSMTMSNDDSVIRDSIGSGGGDAAGLYSNGGGAGAYYPNHGQRPPYTRA